MFGRPIPSVAHLNSSGMRGPMPRVETRGNYLRRLRRPSRRIRASGRDESHTYPGSGFIGFHLASAMSTA